MPFNFNIDSWPWKFAVIFALLGMREFIRLLSPRAREKQHETSRWIIETLDSAAIAIGLVLFIIQPFILQAFYIPSGSMEDTLRIQDRLLVSKLIYRLKEPQFQDVVVFKAPPDALIGQTEQNVDFIKRCMGTPGDAIEVVDRRLYRNGKLVPEPYTKWSEGAQNPFAFAPDSLGGGRKSYDMKIYNGAVYSREYNAPGDPGPWMRNNVQVASDADQAAITAARTGKVPPEFLLMLGDHRSDSNDGHVWGFVPRANIVGKAICVFWPPTRLGLVDKMSVNQKPKL